MSYYGQGGVSADFVGLARERARRALPGVVQIYVSGCSGNVTAASTTTARPRTGPCSPAGIETAMAEAWEATERSPARTASRSAPSPCGSSPGRTPASPSRT